MATYSTETESPTGSTPSDETTQAVPLGSTPTQGSLNGAPFGIPAPSIADSANVSASDDAAAAAARAAAAQGMVQAAAGPQGLRPVSEPEVPSLPGSANNPHQPIAEFLYQLTKMLTDNNSEIVEWSAGKIKVHYPDRLEGEVLHKYFRHSKFASFQRQLNYFGFRKIAGKGKMSPCSYVNDAATSDIRSLLLIKRKTNGSAARKAAMAQRNVAATSIQGPMGFAPGVTISADFFNQAIAAGMGNPAQQQLTMIHPAMMFATPEQQQAILQQQAALQQHVFQNGQKALGESLFLPSDSTLAAFAHQQNQRMSGQDLGSMTKNTGLAGSLEHLQQLTAARNSALSLAGFGGFGSTMAHYAAAAGQGVQAPAAPAPSSAPSPADPGAMPATAAMNATAALNAAASNQSNNMFESNSALTALVGSNPATGDTKGSQSAPAPGAPSGAPYSGPAPGTSTNPYSTLSSANLLRGLPSSGTMFPDSLSSISLSGLLPGPAGMSSNRLNSMLSLSSFLSRDPSMADLLPGASNANLAGFATGGQFGNTTLVPLTGGSSQYANQLGSASAALSSLYGAFAQGLSAQAQTAQNQRSGFDASQQSQNYTSAS